MNETESVLPERPEDVLARLNVFENQINRKEDNINWEIILYYRPKGSAETARPNSIIFVYSTPSEGQFNASTHLKAFMADAVDGARIRYNSLKGGNPSMGMATNYVFANLLTKGKENTADAEKVAKQKLVAYYKAIALFGDDSSKVLKAFAQDN